jgi:TrmH family RNA methyltransferase
MSTRDTREVVLEGFHVCKHAIRNGAVITDLVTPDKQSLQQMSDSLAPDIWEYLDARVREIGDQEFDEYSDVHIRTPLAGRAHITQVDISFTDETKPIVLLDSPRDLENIGAVVRVSAGLEAAMVCTTGEHDPWHKNSVRASQGTHFAVPVTHTEAKLLNDLTDKRPVYVFDESGEDMSTMDIPNNAILVFGGERRGVSEGWFARADKVVRIPQSSAISSYNLATSVAMGLYHSRLHTTDLGK